jgi:hypothetical protein
MVVVNPAGGSMFGAYLSGGIYHDPVLVCDLEGLISLREELLTPGPTIVSVLVISLHAHLVALRLFICNGVQWVIYRFLRNVRSIWL